MNNERVEATTQEVASELITIACVETRSGSWSFDLEEVKSYTDADLVEVVECMAEDPRIAEIELVDDEISVNLWLECCKYFS